MARDCPECSRPVDGFACRACGWRDANAAGPAGDPMHFRCSDTFHGMRCDQYGTLTSNTMGDGKNGAHPGPWFCFKHYPPFKNWNKGDKTLPAGGFDGFRSLVKSLQIRVVEGRKGRSGSGPILTVVRPGVRQPDPPRAVD